MNARGARAGRRRLSPGALAMGERLVIDGSFGEGGGQVLRTALSLAAIAGRPIRIENVRANRSNPGLAAQHLTAVRAAAAICRGRLEGDDLGSSTIELTPEAPPQGGRYSFDVAAQREGGSAGSALLVVQTVLLPLALAAEDSIVAVAGGTHLPNSPAFDYADGVWCPVLVAAGFGLRLSMTRSGWYPIGGGRVEGRARGLGAPGSRRPLKPLVLEEPGRLVRVSGRALAANLPAHVAERMASRADHRLAENGISADVRAERVEAACPGAALTLIAEYERTRAGFSVLGRRGKPAEEVAEEAVAQVLRHARSGAALDLHLGDQVLLPAALAEGRSAFTVEAATAHLKTNAWVIERFGLARIEVAEEPGRPPRVTVDGRGFASQP